MGDKSCVVGWRRPQTVSFEENAQASSVWAEIGVFKGDFSHQIFKTARPSVLHLIDPWKFESSETYKASWYGGTAGVDQTHMDSILQSVQARFQTETASGKVVIHPCDSVAAAQGFADGYFDWVYIDGNHQYEFVMKDLECYLPKVKPGGFIAGDDYGTAGWWQGGVTKAVDEFVGRGGCELIAVKNSQFILKRSPGSR